MAIDLQKEGLIAGLSITMGGQLRVNVYNSTNQVVHLTPKTIMTNIWAEQLEVKYLGREFRVMCTQKERILDFGESPCVRKSCRSIRKLAILVPILLMKSWLN